MGNVDKYKERLMPLAALLAVLALSVLLSGCSMVGYGTGLAIDNSLSDTKTIDPWECGSVKKGTYVVIRMKDSSSYEGLYTGLDTLSTEEYTRVFKESLRGKPSDVNCPQLGDTLRIVDRNGDSALCEFRGFSYEYKSPPRRLGSHSGGGFPYLKARPINGRAENEFRLDFLDTMIGSQGEAIETKDLDSLVTHGLIPLMTVMTVDVLESTLPVMMKKRWSSPKFADVIPVTSNRTIVTIENIHNIEVPRKKYAKYIGFGLGAALDALLVYAAIAFSDMGPMM